MTDTATPDFLQGLVQRLIGSGGIPLNWLLVGYVGQTFFFCRFLVQWIASERQGRSIIPKSFWFLSLSGSIALLAYGVHRKDPVIILGQLPGFGVYIRNLVLLRRAPAPSA